MPTEEMLKKLLEEFVEKHALLDEEIKVVMDQIEHLEQRLTLRQSQLSMIGVDKEKVQAMRLRYANDPTNSDSSATQNNHHSQVQSRQLNKQDEQAESLVTTTTADLAEADSAEANSAEADSAQAVFALNPVRQTLSGLQAVSKANTANMPWLSSPQ